MAFPHPTMEARPMQPAASVDSRSAENRKTYDQLVRVVRGHARRGDVERVLRAATLAANLAWFAPVGALSDPTLERLVRDTVRRDGDVWIDPDRGDGRVLHVLSEGYPVGGHTRLAWRWISRDPRSSDVALTMQRGPAPQHLRNATEEAGGRVYDLAKAFPTLAARAEALRRLMDRASTVVLHVHPLDAVVLAAASLPGPRPPIVYENHADHTYWLGLGAADVIADHRAIGQRLSREVRGVRDERLALLPLPIDAAATASTRKVVRGRLGLRPSQVAAVTVADAYKTSALWGDGFPDLLRRVLPQVPELAVVVVGPPAEGPWKRLQSEFPQRVFPLGVVEDAASLFPGMDVYLDSYPVSSATSILEAALAGLPPLSLLLHTGYAESLHANSPGLARTGYAMSTEDEYVATLRALVHDRDLRRQRSELARREVSATHSGAFWSAALDELYRRTRDVSVADPDEYPTAVQDLDYTDKLVPFTPGAQTVADPVGACWALGDLADERMRFDVFVATHPQRNGGLGVRVSRGWEDHPAWMMRLAGLAQQHPRLSVSLPFVAGDDASGGRSVQALQPVLAANGTTLTDCGDLSLDLQAPRMSGPVVTGELALQAESLDSLEQLLASPMWDEPESATT
jgi:hypothetical protein